MGVTMSREEAWEFIASGHTGILTTLRPDGSPVSVPLWFTVLDQAVYLTTLGASAKVRHIRRDPRVSFLVEAGQAWAELRAVLISGTATIVEDPATVERVEAQLAEKYAGFGVPDQAPAATRRYYSARSQCLRIDPDRPPLSWDNGKLMRPRSARRELPARRSLAQPQGDHWVVRRTVLRHSPRILDASSSQLPSG